MTYLKKIGTAFLLMIFLYQFWTVNKLQTEITNFKKVQIVSIDEDSQEIPQEPTTTTENSFQNQLTIAISQIGQDTNQRQRLINIAKDYSNLSNIISLPGQYGLSSEKVIHIESGLTVIDFATDELAGAYVINLPHQQRYLYERKEFNKFIEEISAEQLREWQKYASIKNQLSKALKNEVTTSAAIQLLKDKNLTTKILDNGVAFITSDNFSLLDIKVAPVKSAYYINNDLDNSFSANELSKKLPQLIAELDTRPELERILSTQKEEFIEMLESKDFAKLIEEQGIKEIGSEQKSDGIYYKYEASDGSEFAIVMEQGTGLIKLVQEGQVSSLDSFIESIKKKTLEIPDDLVYESTGKQNIDEVLLLAGKHGSLTDTLILAYVNRTQQTIKMVSIPRDLSWQDQKINSYFAEFGMNRLVAELERLLKVKISHYALIDMYAFIDVIDILGGVDITLTEALVDPSYKTFDNGEWGTLNYQPGTYHLNGVQALRLARSRHYSSDFARAERQQQILKALKTKFSNLSLVDLPKVIALSRAVLSKVDTDMSLNEVIDYYKRYKNFDLQNVAVLSTGNILTSGYSNQSGYDACIAEGGSNCSKGAYILTPKNNNWSTIPWFVESLL